MGRKIPARRHHGVRDPLVQAAQRLALIKDKINHPPERQDHQEVSNKLADFIRIKNEAKAGQVKKVRDGEDRPENYKSNKTATGKEATTHRHDKALPAIRRLQNESDEDYLRRVNRITHASIRESQFESKYGVEVIRNQRGEITIKKRPADELDVAMKEARRRQKRNGGKDDDADDPVAAKKRKKREAAEAKKMTDAERKALVKQMMAAKKTAKATAASKVPVEYKTDHVAFGEVTHGPPQLVTPRRAQKADTVPRPGAKKSLLLHSVLDQGDTTGKADGTVDGEAAATKAKKPKATTQKTSHDLKGKRRELTQGMRQMIEKQQQNVMDMYRELKKKNRLNNVE